eukprot:TRINITY_DN9965_c0_g1_i1.p1 TRINITY_DN9965_c0_g1~~TRINITY_DN9965_c0_g1_i1.p1  ORF type:complete len:448 (+),score=65.93 TRINITY_DN9965_c0_g1_i1:48-1346(+)
MEILDVYTLLQRVLLSLGMLFATYVTTFPISKSFPSSWQQFSVIDSRGVTMWGKTWISLLYIYPCLVLFVSLLGCCRLKRTTQRTIEQITFTLLNTGMILLIIIEIILADNTLHSSLSHGYEVIFLSTTFICPDNTLDVCGSSARDFKTKCIIIPSVFLSIILLFVLGFLVTALFRLRESLAEWREKERTVVSCVVKAYHLGSYQRKWIRFFLLHARISENLRAQLADALHLNLNMNIHLDAIKVNDNIEDDPTEPILLSHEDVNENPNSSNSSEDLEKGLEDGCPICQTEKTQEECQRGELVLLCPCAHIMHKSCFKVLESNYKSKGQPLTCCVCRKNVEIVFDDSSFNFQKKFLYSLFCLNCLDSAEDESLKLETASLEEVYITQNNPITTTESSSQIHVEPSVQEETQPLVGEDEILDGNDDDEVDQMV